MCWFAGRSWCFVVLSRDLVQSHHANSVRAFRTTFVPRPLQGNLEFNFFHFRFPSRAFIVFPRRPPLFLSVSKKKITTTVGATNICLLPLEAYTFLLFE